MSKVLNSIRTIAAEVMDGHGRNCWESGRWRPEGLTEELREAMSALHGAAGRQLGVARMAFDWAAGTAAALRSVAARECGQVGFEAAEWLAHRCGPDLPPGGELKDLLADPVRACGVAHFHDWLVNTMELKEPVAEWVRVGLKLPPAKEGELGDLTARAAAEYRLRRRQTAFFGAHYATIHQWLGAVARLNLACEWGGGPLPEKPAKGQPADESGIAELVGAAADGMTGLTAFSVFRTEWARADRTKMVRVLFGENTPEMLRNSDDLAMEAACDLVDRWLASGQFDRAALARYLREPGALRGTSLMLARLLRGLSQGPWGWAATWDTAGKQSENIGDHPAQGGPPLTPPTADTKGAKDQKAAQAAGEQKAAKRKKGGRPRINTTEHKQIIELWQQRRHSPYLDIARALGLGTGGLRKVQRAIARHRQQMRRAGNTSQGGSSRGTN